MGRLKEDAALAAVDADKPVFEVWGGGFRLNGSDEISVYLDGKRVPLPARRAVTAEPKDGGIVAFGNGDAAFFTLRAEAQRGAGTIGDGAILAPMPGRIVSVAVAEDEEVAAGQTLVVIEAMKMEQALVAPFAGRVTGLAAIAGGQTTEGAVLVRIEPAD
jgi:3-methylcrotonyl-CoA carboxylase alpha subunit